MTEKIRNREELLSVGSVESRRIVLDVTERVLQKLDSFRRIRDLMRLEGDTLHVGNRSWDLTKKKNIYLFGAGKACNHMARAASEILGDRLTKGVIIVKIPEAQDVYVNTEVFVGGHPLPNEEGMEGCLRMLELVGASGPDDLFIILLSGGSTALMGCPVEGITLKDEQVSRDVMLKSGMRVMDINTVAGHCARINRGRLGQCIEAKGGEIISLNIWDAVGWPDIEDYNEPVEMRGTPVGPDKSTFEDIRQIIEENGLAGRLPENIYNYLMNGTPEQETPKSIHNATYYMLNVLQDSCKFAEEAALELGIPYVTLTTSIEGESKDAGMLLATVAHEMQKTGRPFKPPMLIFSAGETTTTIPDDFKAAGHGGPSQELTAGFAVVARDVPGACMLSIDSEGSDGTTVMAGGLTDSTTWTRTLSAGINLKEALRTHATFEALSPLHDCVFTGNTGTNLCDFNVLYVPVKD